MRTRSEALAELRDLADRVASARRAIANGEVARVVGIEHDIDTVCQAIFELPHDEAMALRPALKALQADLTALFAEMESLRDELHDLEEEIEEEDPFDLSVPPGRTVH